MYWYLLLKEMVWLLFFWFLLAWLSGTNTSQDMQKNKNKNKIACFSQWEWWNTPSITAWRVHSAERTSVAEVDVNWDAIWNKTKKRKGKKNKKQPSKLPRTRSHSGHHNDCSSPSLLLLLSPPPVTPGPPVRRQRVPPRAVPELHEVHLGAALQQLGPFHLLALHLVPAHPPHRRPALPLPGGLHGRLLRDGDQPVLLQPLPERRGVRPQGGRLHLHLPWGLHRWVCAAAALLKGHEYAQYADCKLCLKWNSRQNATFFCECIWVKP